MNTLRGVNLGGWLVLERWMTPKLFDGMDAVDEYTFMQTPDARAKLQAHHRDFIREEDFQWMYNNGVNAVRIPVGYWVFDGDEPFVSCIGRLDWAVRTAARYDIKVLVCLHGAPGSQNGFDHSGRAGHAGWQTSPEARKKTVDVMRRLAEHYSDQPSVWGIELLNEPTAKLWQPTLRAYYQSSYEAIRRVGRPGLAVIFSDAFTPRLMSGALRAYQQFPVYMDHHWYHFFIPGWLQRRLTLRWYYHYLSWKSRVLERISRDQPIIVGEWNGIIGGEKLSQYPTSEHAAIVDTHIAKQLEAYACAAAWFYWSYKTEARGVFHFRSMVEDGRIKLSD